MGKSMRHVVADKMADFKENHATICPIDFFIFMGYNGIS